MRLEIEQLRADLAKERENNSNLFDDRAMTIARLETTISGNKGRAKNMIRHLVTEYEPIIISSNFLKPILITSLITNRSPISFQI